MNWRVLRKMAMILCAHAYIIPMLFTTNVSADEIELLLKDRDLSTICGDSAVSMRWNDGDWIVDSFQQKYSQTILIEELVVSGKTDSQIVSALSKAKENTLIVGHPEVTLDLKGRPLILKSGTSIDGNGMLLISSKKIHSFVRNRRDTQGHVVENLIIKAEGMEQYASIDFTSVDGLIIRGNTISGNTNSAIVVASTEATASKNVYITNNKVHSPAKTVGHLVMVKSRPKGKMINCVAVTDNHILGSNPQNLLVKDYTPENEFTADQIVLHGVEGFLVHKNYSGWSGSAGYTISRLSRDGVISNNIAEQCYEPGFNIGSSVERVLVKSDSKDITVGDILTSKKATLMVQSVKKLTSGSVELRGKVRKDIVNVGDTLSFSDGKVVGMIQAHQRGVENVLLIGNEANDTSIQRPIHKNLAAYNVVRSKDIFLIDNQYGNPKGIGRANKFASFSVSQGYVSANNLKSYGNDDVQVAGPGAGFEAW